VHPQEQTQRAGDTKLRKAWRLTWRIIGLLFVLQLVYILILRFVDPPITTTQLVRWVNGEGFARDYVDWDDISVPMRLAVIASEDQMFPFHDGFDWSSIMKAAERNAKSKKVRGASTISQQVAKNVFLWQGRSYLRKALEVYFTFMIEAAWGKRRILEMYLNVSETGKGTFGVEAAARKNFNKPASKLTQTEAAMIAASLPNPRKYTVKPLSNYVATHYGHVVTQMNNLIGVPEIAALVKAN
jgi:monofunctional biosynthetic peptidoglycan transglycosylase